MASQLGRRCAAALQQQAQRRTNTQQAHYSSLPCPSASVSGSASSKAAKITARNSSRRNTTHTRSFSTTHSTRQPSDDPGGKPNDGKYPTVYDDFKNITASNEPDLSVHSMGDFSFTMSDGLVAHTPILIVNKNVLLWDPPTLQNTMERPIMPSGVGWEEWDDRVWRIFELVTPRPEIIIFGTGRTVLPLPQKVKLYLNRLGIQIEAHDTRNACSTYNLLVEEQRLVAAALLPNDRKPTKRVPSASVS